jgi:mannose-1-phosphate guanylyltransferase
MTTPGHGSGAVYAIVPAGGAGTRLWPMSRAGRPKFLLDLTGSGRSLLQQTWDRLVPVTGPGGIMVVTGQAHGPAVVDQLVDLPAGSLLCEPTPRDSAAAIGLAAAVLHHRDPQAVVASFAADHVIRDVPAFHRAVAEAVVVARAGYVVTIGIQPDEPSTAFGYIKVGDVLDGAGAPEAHLVERFVEKPDRATATAYLAQGGYRWNAGMFVARAEVLLGELARSRPALHRGLLTIAEAWDTDRRDEVLHATWPALEKVAIDYAVAEPAAEAGRMAVVLADFGWDDVGDWSSLAELLGPPSDGRPVRVLGDAAQVLSAEASGVAVPAGNRLVAVLGLEDVVVVDTPDAVLVTTRERAQDVKTLVEELRGIGRVDLT